MSTQPLDVVRMLVEQWNKHDAAQAARLLSENVEYWDVTQTTVFRRRSDVESFFSSFFEAFPHLRFEITNIFAAGPQVACEWRMQGTQEKELDGMSAIGKSIDIAGVSLCRVDEGKIIRQVDYWDSGTMNRQLGLVSTPGSEN